MSKTLSGILTIYKIARILAKIAAVLCIVGGVGCLVAICIMPMLGNTVPWELFTDEVPVSTIVYPACAAGLIACVGEAVFAFLTERYCKNVLQVGTPFTFDGAKECFRLGLASIIISAAVSLLSGIVSGVLAMVLTDSSEFDISVSVSLTTGLVLLFMSMLLKHGAELRASADEAVGAEGSMAAETVENN